MNINKSWHALFLRKERKKERKKEKERITIQQLFNSWNIRKKALYIDQNYQCDSHS
jgi:hypothetical protein